MANNPNDPKFNPRVNRPKDRADDEAPLSEQDLELRPEEADRLSNPDLRLPRAGGLSEDDLQLRPEDAAPPDSEPLPGAPGSSQAGGGRREGDSLFDLPVPTGDPASSAFGGGSSLDLSIGPPMADPASTTTPPP